MKKLYILLLLGAILLSTVGCKSSGTLDAGTQPNDTADVSHTGDFSEPTGSGFATLPGLPDTEPQENYRVRIPYNGKVRNVIYVESRDQLPGNSAFDRYTDDYFAENALVIVTISTSSGSAKPRIDSISYDDGRATVLLSMNMEGDGTSDMACWLLWAEVEAGLDYQWSIGSSNSVPRYSVT